MVLEALAPGALRLVFLWGPPLAMLPMFPEVFCPRCQGPTRGILWTALAVRHVCLSPGCGAPPFDVQDPKFDTRETLRQLPAPPDTLRDLLAWGS